jgi:hypothetical protein
VNERGGKEGEGGGDVEGANGLLPVGSLRREKEGRGEWMRGHRGRRRRTWSADGSLMRQCGQIKKSENEEEEEDEEEEEVNILTFRPSVSLSGRRS